MSSIEKNPATWPFYQIIFSSVRLILYFTAECCRKPALFHFGSLFRLPPSSECCRKPAWPRPLRGERPLGAAVSVPRGWRVFETQRWRAQSRRQKLRRHALKGAASEKGKSHAAAFSMPKSPLSGRYYNRRARSFRGEPPPHAAQMVGRSRGTPPTRPAAVRPWPPASASSVGRRSLGSPAAPSKIHGLGIFLGVFRG